MNYLTVIEIVIGVIICFSLGMIVQAFIDNKTIVSLFNTITDLKKKVAELKSKVEDACQQTNNFIKVAEAKPTSIKAFMKFSKNAFDSMKDDGCFDSYVKNRFIEIMKEGITNHMTISVEYDPMEMVYVVNGKILVSKYPHDFETVLDAEVKK